MKPDFKKALAAGAERVAAWADLLDSINVFPVADGDTGRNMAISLNPLKDDYESRDELVRELLLSARGNSGNISAQFFSGFLTGEGVDSLPKAAETGRDMAYQSVPEPKPGTILTFFDGFVEVLQERKPREDSHWESVIIDRLEQIVRETVSQLPQLSQAGVVDAGALGMFIFFDGFFNVLVGGNGGMRPIAERFENLIRLDPSWQGESDSRYCIDAVLEMDDASRERLQSISDLGEEVVAINGGEYLKVHLHASDVGEVRRKLEGVANLVRWTSDDMGEQTQDFLNAPKQQALHVATDAAGSVTRADARRLGITLLDSYITIGKRSVPETHLEPSEMYSAMQEGRAVSTCQASVFERHQHYQHMLGLYPRVLYLCVGSVFTGNYRTAMDWKATNDPEDRLIVIDTGAASGRLGLLALATARFSLETDDAEAVIAYARCAEKRCEEYIFLEKLQYLAAGGRLSKGSAFFGDVLRMKPVVTPLAEGVIKAGVVRSNAQQIRFAVDKMERSLQPDEPALVMLEYSDNIERVKSEILGEIQRRFPACEIFLQPISLTSGAHMGPGTWAVSFLPKRI